MAEAAQCSRTSGFEVLPTFQEVEVGEPDTIKCETCNGDGKQNIAGMKLECMKCNGKGAWSDSRKRLEPGALAVDESDATLNVCFESIDSLTSLSGDGLQDLVAGVRVNTGIISGRYLLELKTPQHDSSAAALLAPKHLLRLGVSTVGSSPLLAGDSLECAFFDSEGFFTHDKRNDKSCQPFGLGHIMGLLINLDSGPGAASQTLSLFQDGRRASEPQALPEALRGKLLIPTITYKDVSVQLNFSRESWCPLSFKCSMLQDAVVTDIQQFPGPTTDVKHEVLFPIGLPDTGVFDWVDSCLARNPRILELSDRKVLEWASKSGLQRNKGYAWKNSLDRPGLGIPSFDDSSAKRTLLNAASESRRSLVVAELKANLILEERKALLAKFSDARFIKVGVVLIGEPDDLHKAVVQKLLLADKRQKAEDELLRNQVDEARRKFMLDKAEKRSKGRVGSSFTASAGGAAENDPLDEDIKGTDPAELSEDEKAAWHFPSEIPDLTPENLAAYAKFTLPSEDEGFTELRYAWQPKSKCAEIMQKYLLDKRLTTRLEMLRPGECFNMEWSRWSQTLQDWRKLQEAWKENDGDRKAEIKDKRPLEDEDVANVEDIKDIGDGEPLFAKFEYEDWVLLSLRYEMHILCHSFRQDCDDPGHPGIPESHLGFYFNKYFVKLLDIKSCNVATTKELFEIMGGTENSVQLNEDSSVLETLLPQSEPFDSFLKFIEEKRRDRKRCVDAGDESSALTFVRPVPVSTSLGQRARVPRPVNSRLAPDGVPPASRNSGLSRVVVGRRQGDANSRPAAGQLRRPDSAPSRPAPGQLRPARMPSTHAVDQRGPTALQGRHSLRPAMSGSRPAVGQSRTAASPWSRPATAPPRPRSAAQDRPALASTHARPAVRSTATGTTRLVRPAPRPSDALSQPVRQGFARRPASTSAGSRAASSKGHSGYGDPQRSAYNDQKRPAPRAPPGYGETQRAPPGCGAPPPSGYNSSQKRPAPSAYGAPQPQRPRTSYPAPGNGEWKKGYGEPQRSDNLQKRPAPRAPPGYDGETQRAPPGYGAPSRSGYISPYSNPQKRPATSAYGAPPPQRPRTSYNAPGGSSSGGKGGDKGGDKGVGKGGGKRW